MPWAESVAFPVRIGVWSAFVFCWDTVSGDERVLCEELVEVDGLGFVVLPSDGVGGGSVPGDESELVGLSSVLVDAIGRVELDIFGDCLAWHGVSYPDRLYCYAPRRRR